MAVQIRPLANIEYEILSKELDKELQDKWFSKFQISQNYQNVFRLKIQSRNLIIYLPKALFLLQKEIDEQQSTSAISDALNEDLKFTSNKFTETVTEHLKNSRVVSIRKLNNDRIIKISFFEQSLILELFSKGNVILVHNNDNTIISCLREESWKDRIIKKGAIYQGPVTQNMPENFNEFKKYILQSDRDYVVVRLSKLPLGINYIKLILLSIGIHEKKKAVDLSEQELELLWNTIARFFSNFKFIEYKINNSYDFSFFDLAVLDNLNVEILKEHNSINTMLSKIYLQELTDNETQISMDSKLDAQRTFLINSIEFKNYEINEIRQYYNEISEILKLVKTQSIKSGESKNFSFEVFYDSSSKRKLKLCKREQQAPGGN
ncbi:MAG: NFACT family protein [Candidatus Micrarchaeota archaeon]|nr:NFACT family protein [Candidatus Micrarchaeota archaeon]